MKKCPHCAEMIQDEAVKCRFCGESLVPGAADKTANEPERALLRIHPSFKPIFAAYVLAAAITGSSAVAGVILPLPLAGPLVALIIGLPAFGWAAAYHVRRNRTHYILTNHNLTVEVGILARQSTHIPLAKIQDVTVRRTIMDRLIGVGTIVVESAGEGNRLPEIHVDNPVEVSRRILSEAHARSQPSVRSAT